MDTQLSWPSIVSCLAIAIAICSWYSVPKLNPAESVKSDTDKLFRYELQELTEKFTQSLSRVESEMHSSISKLQTDLEGLEENMQKLGVTVFEHHMEKMTEKENLKDIIEMTKSKYLGKIDQKMHVLHRKVQEEFHCLKDKVINTLNSITEFQEERRQLRTYELNFKEELATNAPDAKVRSHISQVPFQMTDDGKDSLDKCENPILNETKQERKESININGNKKYMKKFRGGHDPIDTSKLTVKEQFGDRIKAAEKKLVAEIDEKRKMMYKRISEECKIMKDEVMTTLDNIKDSLNNERRIDVNNWKEDLRKQSQDVANGNAKMTGQISELNRTLRVLDESFERHGKSSKNLAENVAMASDAIHALHARLEYIEENIINKSILVVVIMLDNAILLFLVVLFCAIRGTSRNVNNIAEIRQERVVSRTSSSPASYSTAIQVLRQVQSRSHLERKLCIISFYEETHQLHMHMTQSVTRHLNLEPVEFIIRKHEAILKIPPVFIYFLFVDFNELNVILEDPNVGLGDLRLTTVQAIQKMGGKLVILYSSDPKSKKLDPGKLYNSELLSVTRQQELSSLNRMSRFVSAYDSLSEYQITHLRKIVSDDLNRQ
ncbi:hypothetical protein CHS0354_004286 [Potamilus streckersoni]|uniref:Uncharacterized protein n=1 Tax=Potamilus streckersoni TaxID=2493646 RepID=A0AAE0S4F6_9BIVA|nr:hypothetical protein CHS0354_004286 [Potamilus streckersoni]